MRYIVPLTDGTYSSNDITAIGQENRGINHQVSFKLVASSAPTTGTVTVSVRSPGSDDFESLPDGPVSLTALETLLFQFIADEYQFVIASSDGVGHLQVTDTEFY